MYLVIAISECGTYRETLKCRTNAEAQEYAHELRLDGWSVRVRPPMV